MRTLAVAVSGILMLSACGGSDSKDSGAAKKSDLSSSPAPIPQPVVVNNPVAVPNGAVQVSQQDLANMNLGQDPVYVTGGSSYGGGSSFLSSALFGWLAQAGCLYYTTTTDSFKKSDTKRFFASAGCTLVPTLLKYIAPQ